MKISAILDHVDSGHMVLPEFQRGFVWNRDQVRGLFESLYRRHPVGGLLVWVTEGKAAAQRGNDNASSGIVELLLDGQQRITSIYGVVRGKPPRFFDGNAQAFSGLHFNLESETFEFFHPNMRGDPLWVDVSALMKGGVSGLGMFVAGLSATGNSGEKLGTFVGRLSHLLGITETSLHVEQVTGPDKSIDVVVDIFNRVNSGGTKLSKGDLALARICADWPEARQVMKNQLNEWKSSHYAFMFTMDWLLRSVNSVLTGEAKFQHLHNKEPAEIQEGLKRAVKHINTSLTMIGSRLGLDHDQVLFGRFALPVMVRYLDRRTGPMSDLERDKLLFWFAQAGMWGRFSGSTETLIDRDIAALDQPEGGLDKLLEQLRLWHGTLRVEPGHFTGWSLGARFYPVLYMITRMGEARDWGGAAVPLKLGMLGYMSKLEVHHIFPKAQLYKRGYNRAEVNALANFCFLTKETNLTISDRLPEEYFEVVEANHSKALASQWIPMDRALWKIESFRDFLEARKVLLANEVNRRMEDLLHGDVSWLGGPPVSEAETQVQLGGSFSSDEEEQQLQRVNEWLAGEQLPEGVLGFECSDPGDASKTAILDLAWPNGVQQGYSQPVALLLNESAEVLAFASGAGFRCFTSVSAFRRYVEKEILAFTYA